MTNMANLFLLLVATLGLVSATPTDKCTFVPAVDGTRCVSGCYIEATKLCAINCPYSTTSNGKCSKK